MMPASRWRAGAVGRGGPGGGRGVPRVSTSCSTIYRCNSKRFKRARPGSLTTMAVHKHKQPTNGAALPLTWLLPPPTTLLPPCRPSTPAQIARSISARARAAAKTEGTTAALERRLSSRRESMRIDSTLGGEAPLPIAEEDGEQDLEAEVRSVCCVQDREPNPLIFATDGVA